MKLFFVLLTLALLLYSCRTQHSNLKDNVLNEQELTKIKHSPKDSIISLAKTAVLKINKTIDFTQLPTVKIFAYTNFVTVLFNNKIHPIEYKAKNKQQLLTNISVTIYDLEHIYTQFSYLYPQKNASEVNQQTTFNYYSDNDIKNVNFIKNVLDKDFFKRNNYLEPDATDYNGLKIVETDDFYDITHLLDFETETYKIDKKTKNIYDKSNIHTILPDDYTEPRKAELYGEYPCSTYSNSFGVHVYLIATDLEIDIKKHYLSFHIANVMRITTTDGDEFTGLICINKKPILFKLRKDARIIIHENNMIVKDEPIKSFLERIKEKETFYKIRIDKNKEISEIFCYQTAPFDRK